MRLLKFSEVKFSNYLRNPHFGFRVIVNKFHFHINFTDTHIKGSTKTSMLCAKSMTCSPQLPEYLTVRNSQKQQQTIAKAAGLFTPFNLANLAFEFITIRSY